MKKIKIIRTATVPISLDILLKGQLQFLSETYEVIAVSGENEHLKNVKVREGVRTEAIEMQRNISPLKDLISLYNLFVFFKKEKPQIVHSITPKAGLLSMVAAYFAGVPIRIHTFTGLIFPTRTGVMQKILILMDKIVCRFATTIYPEGQGVKEDLQKYGITKKPLKIILNGNVNGIDIDYFNPETVSEETKSKLRQKLGISPNDFVFVFIGRLVADKGINEAIMAFKRFKNDEIKFLLVGPYEENDPLLETNLSEISSNRNIITVGFQQDVRTYFGISDVLIFPSYREGFPNVVMQAGAMNLPSIVTDINGSREIIHEGKNGTILPVKNENALFLAMKKIYEDQNYREELQKNSRHMIVSRYQQNKVWQAIQGEYDQLLKATKNV